MAPPRASTPATVSPESSNAASQCADLERQPQRGGIEDSEKRYNIFIAMVRATDPSARPTERPTLLLSTAGPDSSESQVERPTSLMLSLDPAALTAAELTWASTMPQWTRPAHGSRIAHRLLVGWLPAAHLAHVLTFFDHPEALRDALRAVGARRGDGGAWLVRFLAYVVQWLARFGLVQMAPAVDHPARFDSALALLVAQGAEDGDAGPLPGSNGSHA